MSISFPTELPVIQDQAIDARDVFDRDTVNHAMTVLHDDGIYRHLRFRAPDSGLGWYELVTSPGMLTIAGDHGTHTFRRAEDMFWFFNGWASNGDTLSTTRNQINAGYWAEKVEAGTTRAFDTDAYNNAITAEFLDAAADLTDEEKGNLWSEVDEYLLGAETLDNGYENLSNWDNDLMPLTDFHEIELDTWDWHYLWNCWAIVSGIARYAAATGAALPETAAASA